MTTFKPFLSALAFLLLTSCATNPMVEKQHYFLPDSASESPSSAAVSEAPLIQLRAVALTDFLDNEGLVLQLDDITLNQAKNHVWAESLQQQIHRGLRERINQQQQTLIVVGAQESAALSLSVEIDAFHGRYDGTALTRGQWQLKNKQGELVALNRFRLNTELKQSGYPALVRALGLNLDRLAALIAKELKTLDLP